jgi:hypothetical protein
MLDAELELKSTAISETAKSSLARLEQLVLT